MKQLENVSEEKLIRLLTKAIALGYWRAMEGIQREFMFRRMMQEYAWQVSAYRLGRLAQVKWLETNTGRHMP